MKVSDEEKVRQRALELERLKQSLFDSNKSTDPRLVTAAVQPSVSLMAPVPPRTERPEVSEGGEKYPDESTSAGLKPVNNCPRSGHSTGSFAPKAMMQLHCGADGCKPDRRKPLRRPLSMTCG